MLDAYELPTGDKKFGADLAVGVELLGAAGSAISGAAREGAKPLLIDATITACRHTRS